MPSFGHKDGRYFVSYITGPSHVMVGLSFGPADKEPLVVCLSNLGSCNHGTLDETRIRESVLAGVAEACVELHPAEIVYCEGDSSRYDIYQQCGYVLAQRVASGAEFPEMHDHSA